MKSRMDRVWVVLFQSTECALASADIFVPNQQYHPRNLSNAGLQRRIFSPTSSPRWGILGDKKLFRKNTNRARI